MATAVPPNLDRHFPALSQVEDAIGREVLSLAKPITLPAHTTLFRPGDLCENYLMVIKGRVKVVGRSPSGREIVLYRIAEGGTCVLTTACLLGNERYPAEGISETEVTAYAIPRARFQEGLDQSPGLRRFIFDSYGQRLGSLITLVQEVAFERIDLRLARLLLDRGRHLKELHLTHQALATELGSAREVVSRQLKELEQRGWLRLGRGTIEVKDLAGLQRFIDEHE